LGIGDWGLGIGDWGFGPIPNPHIIFVDFKIYLKIYLLLYNYFKNVIKIKHIRI
jgi:hypothetical protein